MPDNTGIGNLLHDYKEFLHAVSAPEHNRLPADNRNQDSEFEWLLTLT